MISSLEARLPYNRLKIILSSAGAATGTTATASAAGGSAIVPLLCASTIMIILPLFWYSHASIVLLPDASTVTCISTKASHFWCFI